MNFPSQKMSGEYSAVRSSEDCNVALETLETNEFESRRRTVPLIHAIVLVLVSVVLTSVPSYFLGGRHAPTALRELAEPSGNINYPMIYNKTFTLSPSPESNAAWDSMFPEGVGFVKHPQISPQFSGVAVFHELHCVNILRIGYYAALDGSLEDMQHVHDHNKRPDPHHLRHCFDYLRQALMCAADTNLEPVDLQLGGVTGWRFERTCRDFEAVKNWAEANRHWPGELSE